MPDLLQAAMNAVNFLLDKGPFALLLMITIGEIGMPVPVVTDGLLLVAGYEGSRMTFAFVMLLAGSLLGASISYWAARLGGRPFVRRYGVYVGLTVERLDGMETRIHGWGARAVVIGRMTPGLLFVTNAASGFFRIPYPVFAICVLVTAAVWGVIALGAGYLMRLGFGATVQALARNQPELWAVPIVLFIGGVLVSWIVLRSHLARKRAGAGAASTDSAVDSSVRRSQ